MTDDEIEAFADFIHDAAIQYANGHETDFRPVARRIAQASRRAALEEADQQVVAQTGDSEIVAWMHDADKRPDCISDDVKRVLLASTPKIAEHYTIPLYDHSMHAPALDLVREIAALKRHDPNGMRGFKSSTLTVNMPVDLCARIDAALHSLSGPTET